MAAGTQEQAQHAQELLDPTPGKSGGRWKPYVGALVSVALVCLAIWVLHRFTQDVTVGEIRDSLDDTPPGRILIALIATAVSFAALAGFDIVATRTSAPGRVSWWVAAAAGSAGFAVSNALGFGVLTAGSLRYRIYSSEGLDAADVVRVMATSWMTFWLGFVSIFGLTLTFAPGTLTDIQWMTGGADRAVGIVVLAALVAFVVWLGRTPRTVRLGGWSLRLPDAKMAIAQILLGSIDLAASAIVLYALLPSGSVGSVPYFLLVYVGAVILGLISHAPGGVGAFEATLVAGLGVGGRADVIAALIVYRIIYYVLPLGVTAVGLVLSEGLRRKERIQSAAGTAQAILRPIVPIAAAALVFLAGVVLLISGVLPAVQGRLGVLRHFVPLAAAETSHLLASVIGVCLLIVGRGLVRRLQFAWVAALVLLAASAFLSLAKGLDWEEAAIMAAIAVALISFRSAFYRRGFSADMHLSLPWLVMVIATVAAATWLGFFTYRHVEYSSDLWWNFAWHTHEHGNASRFLRATVAVGILILWIGIDTLVNRRFALPFEPDPIDDRIRNVVAASPNTNSYLALLGDKKMLMTADESAFLMYGRSGKSWVSMGDPVGPDDTAVDLIWRFRELADRNAGRVVFYSVGPGHIPTYLDMGLGLLKIGEVARVNLTTFSLAGGKRADFRYANKRAEREGITFEVMPKADVPAHMTEFRGVSDAWLESKSGSEKGFSLGFFSESYVSETDAVVLRQNGEIIAFANLWRGAEKEELSIDMMRYLPGRSSVLMDALFAQLLLWGKAEGYRWFNLGAAPLAGLSNHPLASTWNRVGTLLYRRGEDFYRFEGLKAFKQKFDPVWTPQYIACPGGLVIPQVLMDVTALVSRGRFGMLRK
ncbi:phosphatidylglycerol lysyltransferase [Faunimonas pinastri]|uniref:Phosphatidylglycerol lysyltransferase n=2 Tax=Faunimonas pinastri TaxID=1855383 RepID=A0A1H8ZYX6_9HYPH|nr:phosphatidylglycerol lysyltransferase [Faunimonas pinastri]